MEIYRKIKKITSTLIILSMLAMPFSNFVPRARAQSPGINSLVGGSASGYITGLVPAIINLPGCEKILKNEVKSLFGGSTAGSIKTKAVDAGWSMNSVPVNLSPAINLKIDNIDTKTSAIKTSTQETDKIGRAHV